MKSGGRINRFLGKQKESPPPFLSIKLALLVKAASHGTRQGVGLAVALEAVGRAREALPQLWKENNGPANEHRFGLRHIKDRYW